MSVLRIDVTNAPSSLLLRMNSDAGALREQVVSERGDIAALKEAGAEVAAEINRRLPIPERTGMPVEQRDRRHDAIVQVAIEASAHWRENGTSPALAVLLDKLAELTDFQGPACEILGICKAEDGSGTCFGCGRYLEEDLKPIRVRVRLAVIELIRALDEADLAVIPENRFDPEVDAIIYAARGL